MRTITKSFWVWAIAPAVFCVFAIWYQFGFTLGGVLEEWDFLWLLQRHPTFWNSFPGNLMADQFAARPLQVLPFKIAQAISANSFAGFNLLLMAACFSRVVVGAWIGKFLFRSRAYAAAVGLLFLLFPADTQQFAFRTVNVSCAVALMIAGVSTTMYALTGPRSNHRMTFVFLSICLCVVATWIYEPVITFYSLPLLFIWARCGFKKSVLVMQHRMRFALVWCLGPLISAAYLYYAMKIYGSAYESAVSGGGMLKSILGNAPYLLHSLAYRVFFDAWMSSWAIVTTQIADYKFISVSGVLLIALLLSLAWRDRANAGLKLQLRIIVSGLIALLAGYVPYMASSYHMETTQRTFISVAPGASLVLIGLIASISRRYVTAGTAISCVFIIVSMVAQLYQFDRYVRDYTGITLPYMSQVTDKIDRTKSVHLIMDSTGYAGHMMGMYMTKAELGIPVRANDPAGSYFLCLDQPSTPYLLFNRCSKHDGIWTVTENGLQAMHFPDSKVQTIVVDKSLQDSYRSKTSAWHDEGTFVPTESMFKTQDPGSYSCVADSLWGWSGFCRGNGWSDGMFSHASFRHQAFFGAVASDASLIFTLAPVNSGYRLSVKVFGGMDVAIIPVLKLAINGVPVEMHANGDAIEAPVARGLLHQGQNEIIFRNALPAGRQIGLLVSRIDLMPAR